MSKRVFAPNNSFDNEFSLQVHFHVNQTQFHMKCFTRGLALKHKCEIAVERFERAGFFRSTIHSASVVFVTNWTIKDKVYLGDCQTSYCQTDSSLSFAQKSMGKNLKRNTAESTRRSYATPFAGYVRSSQVCMLIFCVLRSSPRISDERSNCLHSRDYQGKSANPLHCLVSNREGLGTSL